MATTPLTNLAPAQYREKIYWVYALVGVVLGAIHIAVVTIDANVMPDWLKVALAVYAYLGVALGATAGSNVNPTPISPADDRPATRPAGDPPVGGV
jgi:hypothetical protein